MEQFEDAQAQIKQLKIDQSRKNSLQDTQLATATEEIKQLQNQSSMAATLASLQAKLKEAHTRENKLKVATCYCIVM